MTGEVPTLDTGYRAIGAKERVPGRTLVALIPRGRCAPALVIRMGEGLRAIGVDAVAADFAGVARLLG